jgi:hypothetical protein
VLPKPAAIDRELEAGAILGRAAFVIEQERAVDKLNKDASVLHRLDRIGDLKKLARGGISEGAGCDEFVHARTSKLSLYQPTGDLDFMAEFLVMTQR